MEDFLRRLMKGPPPQYRWLAWSFIGSVIKGKTPKSYENLLIQGRDPSNKCIHDIEKDINRTFPEHPYFNNDQLGSYG